MRKIEIAFVISYIILSFCSCSNNRNALYNSTTTKVEQVQEEVDISKDLSEEAAFEDVISETEKMVDSLTSTYNDFSNNSGLTTAVQSTSKQINKEKHLAEYLGMKTGDLVVEFGNNYHISSFISFKSYYIEYDAYQFFFEYKDYSYNQLEEYSEKNGNNYPPITGNEIVTGVRYSGNTIRTITVDLTTDITLGELRERFDIIKEGFSCGLGAEYRVDLYYNGLLIAFSFDSPNPKLSEKAIAWSVRDFID